MYKVLTDMEQILNKCLLNKIFKFSPAAHEKQVSHSVQGLLSQPLLLSLPTYFWPPPQGPDVRIHASSAYYFKLPAPDTAQPPSSWQVLCSLGHLYILVVNFTL